MYLDEFLERVKEPDSNMLHGWSEKEIRAMVKNKNKAGMLTTLFCYAKAMEDPSPRISELRKNMREGGATEKEIAEMSTVLTEKEFEYPMWLQEAFMYAFNYRDRGLAMGRPELARCRTIEDCYELAIA